MSHVKWLQVLALQCLRMRESDNTNADSVAESSVEWILIWTPEGRRRRDDVGIGNDSVAIARLRGRVCATSGRRTCSARSR